MVHLRYASRRIGLMVATLLATICTQYASPSSDGLARAADLNPAHVPADAKWLIHIDYEKLADLELVEQLREAHPELTQMVKEYFQSEYGIDPQEDWQSATMFSRDYRRYTGVIVLQTHYDRGKALDKLRASGPVDETQWKGETLYTVTLARHHGHQRPDGDDAVQQGHDTSGGKQMTAYLGDDLVVLASSVSNTKSVLQLLNGESESLAGSDSVLVAQAPKGAVIYGAAIELGKLKDRPAPMPVLQNQQQAVYAFGKRDGELYETLTLTAQSEETAAKTKKVLEGLIAYEQLWAADSEALHTVMEQVELSQDGLETTVNWQGDESTLAKAIEDVVHRISPWWKKVSGAVLAR